MVSSINPSVSNGVDSVVLSTLQQVCRLLALCLLSTSVVNLMLSITPTLPAYLRYIFTLLISRIHTKRSVECVTRGIGL